MSDEPGKLAGAFSSEVLSWLSKINEPAAPKPTPEDEEAAEDASEAWEEAREKLANRSRSLDIKLRDKYCPRLFVMVIGWLIFVAVFLFLASIPDLRIKAGSTTYLFGVNASDTVLVTLLGTTTATVVGLFLVVAKWLFPERKGQDF